MRKKKPPLPIPRWIVILGLVAIFPLSLFAAATNTLKGIRHIPQDQYRTLLEFESEKTPDYEIYENIKSNIIIVKFRSTALGSSLPGNLRLDDPLIRGFGIQTIDDAEHWVKIKTNFQDLLFRVVRDPKAPNIVGLQLYRLNLTDVEKKGPEISNILREVAQKRETLFIYSDRPIQTEIVWSDALPERPVRVRLLNARLGKHVAIPSSATDMIKGIRMERRGKYLVLQIVPQRFVLNVRKRIAQDPLRLILELSEDRNRSLSDLKREEERRREEAKREDQKTQERERFLTVKFKEAERHFRIGRFKTAALLFRNIFNAAPNLDIGIWANFRSADSLYQYQLAKRERNGDEFVIQEYKAAINAALNADLGYDHIPRAYYNIGRSYLNLGHYGDAFNQFEILIDLYPESPYAKTALFHQGIIHLNMMRYRKTIETLEKYVEENAKGPKIPAAYYKIGEAEFQLKKYADAKRNFDRGWSLDPDYMKKDAGLMFHMGETYFENGDLQVARSIYEKLIDLYPEKSFSSLTAIRIGDFLRDEDKYDDAIRAYEKAIDRYPKELSLVGKLRIANILSERPDNKYHKKAIEIYDFILTKNALSEQAEEAQLRKGLTLSLFQEHSQAVSTMEAFCRKFPKNVYVQYGIVHERILETIQSHIEHFYYRGEYLKALGVFEQYEKQYYTHPQYSACFQLEENQTPKEAKRKLIHKAPLFLIADSYDRLGLQDKALKTYDAILREEENPLKPLVTFNKGKIYDSKEKPEEAQKIYEQFIHSYPDDILTPLVKKALGDSYFKVHKSDRISRAIRIYKQTIKDYQNSDDMLQREIVPSCWFALANLYRDIGQYDNAIDAYKNVIETYEHPLQDPDVEEYVLETHFILGNLYFELNQIPEARESYTDAIALFPESQQAPWAKFQIGQIYLKTGQKRKAMEIFAGLIQTAKSNPDALWGPLAEESHKELVNELKFDRYLNRMPSPTLPE